MKNIRESCQQFAHKGIILLVEDVFTAYCSSLDGEKYGFMRQKYKMTFAIIMAIPLLILIVLTVMSHFKPQLGLIKGQLKACSNSPNCVCSESASDVNTRHAIAPFKIKNNDQAWAWIKQAVISNNGQITHETNDYLHAEFTSRLFRFVDDVEIRLAHATPLIHIRSASRVGRSDFGANQRRVEQLRATFNSLQAQQ
ncbi:MAG: DUF1499 domain-containing protein [Mariprofundaceae bacterium]